MPATKQPLPKGQTRRRGYKAELNEERVIAMAKAGVTQRDIAKVEGVDSGTICRFLQAHDVKADELTDFRKGRIDILTELQRVQHDLRLRIMRTMDGDAVKSLTSSEKIAWIKGLSVSSGIDFDKERLESGQSTANVHSLVGLALQEADRRDGLSCTENAPERRRK